MRALAAATLAVVLVGCGSTPAPTAPAPTGALTGNSPTAAVAAAPSPATTALPAAGGTVALTDGTSLSVPAGAVPAGTVARIEPVASVTEIATENSPLLAVGAAYRFDLSDASPSKPVTITMRFSPAGLPAGTTPAEVFLAYRDDATGHWVPVSSTVDAAAGTVSAAVSHLSIWNPMTWDWHYWIPIVKAAASGKVTDLRDRLATFVSGCETSTGIFSVDNAAANQMIEGCLTKTSASDATVEIRNLRAFALEVSGPPGSPTATPELLPPGGTTDVTVKTSAAQPVVVSADVTEVGLCHSVVQVLLRFLPFDRLLTTSPQYWPVVAAVTDRVPMLCTSVGTALTKAQAGDAQGAAATLVSVLQGADFQRALLDALGEAGAKYGLPYLGALTTDRLREVFTIANLGDLIVTTVTFAADKLANSHTEVRVGWQVEPPVARCPFDTSIAGGPSDAERPIPSSIPKYLPVELVPAGAMVFVTTLWDGWADPIWTVGPGKGTCSSGGGNYLEQTTLGPQGQAVGGYDFPGSAGPNQTTSCAYIPAAREAAKLFVGGTLGPSDCQVEAGVKVINIPTGVPNFWIAAVIPVTDAARQSEGPSLFTFQKTSSDGSGASSSASCAPKTSSRMCLSILAFFVPQSYGGGDLSAASLAAIDAQLADLLGVRLTPAP